MISFSVNSVYEVDAEKATGKSGWKYGSATAHIVCGDRLCSEIKNNELNILSEKSSEESPLIQYKNGISIEDIKCNGDHVLIMKKVDNTPACVKPSSVEDLFKRGWGTAVMIQ